MNLTAASVAQAIEALGPNVTLATIKLDAFKAHFISEDEVRILAPMERKREGSEMGIDDIKDSAPATPASATAAPAKKSHVKKKV